MSKNNLILLEGTPGSGKSTAAVYLQGFLENKSPYTHLWREGDFDHPADFEGVACLNGAGYRDVLLRYPELSVLFQEHLTTHGASGCRTLLEHHSIHSVAQTRIIHG